MSRSSPNRLVRPNRPRWDPCRFLLLLVLENPAQGVRFAVRKVTKLPRKEVAKGQRTELDAFEL
jgi:hypothetical protein